MSKRKSKPTNNPPDLDSDDGYLFSPPDYGDDDTPVVHSDNSFDDINKLYIVALIDPDTGEIIDEINLTLGDFGLLKRFS